MSDESGADPVHDPDPGESPLPPCPRCDAPVARTTMVGPAEAVAGPCGCRVSPAIVERIRDD